MTSLPPLEDRPDQPADHLAPAAAQDTAPLHPWARYWAKMVDMGVFLVLALIVMSMLGWNGESLDVWAWTLWITVFPLAEAVLVARFAGTIGYELLTNLGARHRRHYRESV